LFAFHTFAVSGIYSHFNGKKFAKQRFRMGQGVYTISTRLD
jgi:hypothetical protein